MESTLAKMLEMEMPVAARQAARVAVNENPVVFRNIARRPPMGEFVSSALLDARNG